MEFLKNKAFAISFVVSPALFVASCAVAIYGKDILWSRHNLAWLLDGMILVGLCLQIYFIYHSVSRGKESKWIALVLPSFLFLMFAFLSRLMGFADP